MEPAACAVCSQTRTRPVLSCRDPDRLSEETFSLVECWTCGHLYVSPRPADADLGRFYYREYYRKPSAGVNALVGAGTRAFLSLRGRKIPGAPGRLLDVGCGDGDFLAAMAGRGWKASGVETSEAGAAMARSRGLEVWDKPLHECPIPEGAFDVVTFWHVLEHLSDPGRALDAARRALKDEGLLFLAVPNAAGWELPLFSCRWFHLDMPRHLQHFDPDTLSRLLAARGFRVERVEYQAFEYNAFGFFQSALNALGGPMNFFYRLAKGGRFPKLGPLGWARAVLTLVLAGPPAAVLAVVYALVSAAAGRSGCFNLHARKAKT